MDPETVDGLMRLLLEGGIAALALVMLALVWSGYPGGTCETWQEGDDDDERRDA